MHDPTDQLRAWSKALADAVDPADAERIKSPMTPTAALSNNRRWLAAAASVIMVGAGIFAAVTLGNHDPDQISPANNPPQPAVETTTATNHNTVPPTTTAPSTTASPTTASPTTSPPTTATPTTSTPTTASPTTLVPGPNRVAVPLNPGAALPLQPISTVEYGPGDEQIEVQTGEFPPPAVWYIGGVLVLEDARETGLTGHAVIVETGPGSVFEGGTGRSIRSVTIDVAEAGGSPIAVRSLDGGGIVVVTAHDEQPGVRIRRYSENPPGVIAESGAGADRETLGDSQLRITADGATWGGEVVIPPNESNPAAVRPIVAIDPAFGPSSSYEISRPPHDGAPATAWTLDVEIDQEFPPGAGSPTVEPFGDGALVLIQSSSAQFAQPAVVVLGGDGGGVTYDLDGWSVSDVRPEGALLTRSTPSGLELALLAPTN